MPRLRLITSSSETRKQWAVEALEAVDSIEVDLHITDPGFEVDGIYRAAGPGRMRVDVRAGGGQVFTEA
jgi:hypothetical protein